MIIVATSEVYTCNFNSGGAAIGIRDRGRFQAWCGVYITHLGELMLLRGLKMMKKFAYKPKKP